MHAGGVPEDFELLWHSGRPPLFAEPLSYAASCQFSGLPSAPRCCGSALETWAGTAVGVRCARPSGRAPAEAGEKQAPVYRALRGDVCDG